MSSVVSLFHRDLGGAGHPPLLILHGMIGSSRNWQMAGRDLGQRFHVSALDLRNHGNSPHADEMSYSALVDDVLAWMDAQSLSRATLLGHSMGGKVAMLLACRHPARVERLMVIDIAPKDYYWAAHRVEFAAMSELDLANLASRAEAELRLEARVDDWAKRKFITTNLNRTPEGHWGWQINLPVLIAALSTLEKNPLAADDRFVGPTQFVTGEKSSYVTLADHTVVRRHFPEAQIETIADCGHNPHMEKREEFVRTVLGIR